jgi:ADP-ribose pyrophosphatase YjhB (NUDIX family)
MTGTGPFLWLNEHGPPAGFRRVPEGGLCVSAFLFVERDGRLLLGKYAEDPRWEALTGLDASRVRLHGKGWTLPASHLKYGEDPRDAAARIAREVLGVEAMTFSEPFVGSECAAWDRPSGSGLHYDLWFLFEGKLPRGVDVARPPWFAELAWKDPSTLPEAAWARGHADVLARWRALRSRA